MEQLKKLKLDLQKQVEQNSIIKTSIEHKEINIEENQSEKKKIENSKLIINEEGDHFAIYNYPYHFIRALKEFLNA